MITPKRFCVYEHWRPDTGVCFYVGKGLSYRPHNLNDRNQHHARIVAKLMRLGFSVEIKIVVSELTDEEACTLEIERIAYWRGLGVKLANLTAGGEGLKAPSAEVLAKMRAAHKKRWTAERRENVAQKMREMWQKEGFREKYIGRPRPPVSDETRAKISAANKGRKASAAQIQRMTGVNNPFYGKRHSPELQKMIADKKRGTKASLETRARMSATRTGRKQSPEWIANRANALRGLKRSDEVRAQMSARRKGIPISEETKRKLSLALRGRTLSAERVVKLIEGAKGRKRPGPHSADHRAKIAAGNRGKVVNAESRARMSAAQKLRALIKREQMGCILPLGGAGCCGAFF